MRVVEGVLQAGAVVTPYARAGRGAAVLLLRDAPVAELAACRILVGLAAAFRVTAAGPPPGDRAGWLRNLIDGLGLDRPWLVADPSLGGWAREFAADHPERVRGVALLGSGGSQAGELDRLRRELGGAGEAGPAD